MHFEWYLIDLLALVAFVYASAIRRREFRDVYLALGFWGLEFIWELFNAQVQRWAGYPLWELQGKSAYPILVGLNVEIAVMFALMPFVLFALIDGLGRSRWIPFLLGVFCVAIETLLYLEGALLWHWWFWRWPFVPLIVLVYSGPLMALAWVRQRLDLGRDSRE